MALIDKNAPAPPSFEELTRQAEQDAGVPPDSELYAEFGVESPEPDETGRVPASRPQEEAPVEAEAPAETPAPVEAEPAEVVEDVEVEAPAEPDRLEDLNKKVGQLINENADLRRQQAEQADLWAQQQVQQARPSYSPDDFNSLVEEDPAGAIVVAYQNGDQLGFGRAWQAWNEVSPGAPQIWWDNQNLRSEMQAMQQQLVAQVAPAQQLAQRSEIEQALSNVAARHPDFAQVVGTLDEDRIVEIAQSGMPLEILEKALSGDQADKERVYETIYRWVKSDQAGQLVQAAQDVGVRQSEEARAAKREATVASATITTPDPVEESEADRMMRAGAGASLRDGWEGRDSRQQRLGR